MCIIVVLVSLTLYAISVSKNNVAQEIVKYNKLTLHNTMESYEKHLDMLNKQMYSFYYSESVQRLQREPLKTGNYPEIIEDIQNWVSNPHLFIGNIVFYSKAHQLVLEKDTSTSPDFMFDVFFQSDRYPLEFWNKQFDETYTNRIFPADDFFTDMFRNRHVDHGEYIPVIYRITNNRDFYMAVFLDATKMYEAFRQTINENFIMYNAAGETVFERTDSGPFLPLDLIAPYGGETFVVDNEYYFSTSESGSGITYIHRLPVAQLSSQTRLNVTMIVVIVSMVLFSILMSFLLADRMNQPLKKLIQSFRGLNDAEPYRSNIAEFDMIGGRLNDNNKRLKQWVFFNSVKDIRGHENQDKDTLPLEFSDRAFAFILFHVVDKKHADRAEGAFRRWLYYIKVFIEVKLQGAFPDALTIQVEHNQILSQVFLEDPERLHVLLQEMKSVFDQDSDSGTITIAVSSTYSHSGQVSEAYAEVCKRLGDRRLADETQIVYGIPENSAVAGFTQEQEKEFQANLKEGNLSALNGLTERLFARWREQDLSASSWHRLAEMVEDKIRQTIFTDQMSATKLEEILRDARERIRRCVTIEELERLLSDWLGQICESIQERKEKKDPITSFVMDYVNDNLSDEIYLDTLAEKLNISSGYLSTYFKEKTGINVVEYINEARIRKATVLLTETPTKIQDIAERVGYRNMTSFNRMFKKYTGLKPSDYRKSRESPSEDSL
jgi:AraC-like DNA-binding protein